MIAEVIINTNAIALNKELDYIIPENLEQVIKVGSRVLVPLISRIEEGYVVGIKETSKFANKDIAKLEDNILTEENIELAKLMSKRYFCNIADCIKLMLPPGDKTKNLNSRIKDKTANFVYLNLSVEEIAFDIEIGKVKGKKQIAILNFLIDNEGIHILDLMSILETTKDTINKLVKMGYIEIVEKKVERNPFQGRSVERDNALKLTEEQKLAFDKIKDSKFKEFLIYGITGSGKTEIYLQLIEHKLKQSKSALMLVPEISLTPQMVDRFSARFGYDNIAVLHSKLSIGERYDTWQKIREGKVKIVIGARSAIFAPLDNLGIIIIDEEHDSSYKSDMSPKYNCKDIAKYIARKQNIPLILGSATPEIVSYYKATTNRDKSDIIKLTKRANKSNLPEVQIIDLKQELAEGNRSIISRKLKEEIQRNLDEKKQTILFLNRRGFSTFVMCRDCGYTIKCKKCNINLTYHKSENKLKCHYCGYEIKNVTVCPKCGSKNIKYFGTGTQKLEELINQEFPTATTIRMDIDTVNKKNSHEEILRKFKEENIDILIGTQMVVKGHHFPNVTLVGVISADGSLNSGDFRATEKTFDLLTQVAGRAGRDKYPGRVIIQTYSPENFAINCAKEQNYDNFYNLEIALRKQLKYPPFCDIITFGVSSTKKDEVELATKKLYNILNEKAGKSIEVFSPLPAPIDKIKGKYRWRIVAKAKLNMKILNIINATLEDFYKLNYKNIRIYADVNPNNMV